MMKRLLPLAIMNLLVFAQVASSDVIEPLRGRTIPETASVKSARIVDVEERTRNECPQFIVRIDVDRKDRTYEAGELIHVTVQSEKDGYLYLINRQADGKAKCLFPNQYETDNHITHGEMITLPTARQRFNLRVAEPLGEELLIALVTLEPLESGNFGAKSLTDAVVTEIDLDTLIAKGINVELRDEPAAWAEHSVRIKTVAPKAREAEVPKRRLGLFVGVSRYQDSRIPDLHVCDVDAAAMALVMQEHGNLDGIGILVNEKATYAHIKKAFEELREKSRPGDTIFLYWSGHGASCADTGGDEKDGRDEFLVPFDGDADNPQQTMLLDDTLGRWVQALDGREVVVILDACHSGGHATDEPVAGDTDKGLGEPIIQGAEDLRFESVESLLQSVGRKSASEHVAWGFKNAPADLLDSELSGVKDIGQDDAVMLFSSASDEISAERRDKKLSVMTYCLIEKLVSCESLTLREAFDHIEAAVPAYMQAHFPNRRQTPQLLPPDSAATVVLR